MAVSVVEGLMEERTAWSLPSFAPGIGDAETCVIGEKGLAAGFNSVTFGWCCCSPVPEAIEVFSAAGNEPGMTGVNGFA